MDCDSHWSPTVENAHKACRPGGRKQTAIRELPAREVGIAQTGRGQPDTYGSLRADRDADAAGRLKYPAGMAGQAERWDAGRHREYGTRMWRYDFPDGVVGP